MTVFWALGIVGYRNDFSGILAAAMLALQSLKTGSSC
jgi:hypothetical protein